MAALIALAGVWITAFLATAVATFLGAVGAVEPLAADCRVQETITSVLYDHGMFDFTNINLRSISGE